jgi:cytochrome c oxidase cbb3-type subunit 1
MNNQATEHPEFACRWPVLCWWAGSAFWLIVGCLLALGASLSLVSPGLLENSPWTTYGRLQPAAMNALIYGFATPAGLGLTFWMLNRSESRATFFILAACALWNLGMLIGILGILAGGSTGCSFLEMPLYANALLAVALVAPAFQILRNFALRAESADHPSAWQSATAVFWFALLFGTGVCLLLTAPWRGAAHLAANTWFANNLLFLWLTPLSLAAVYYVIPQELGRPLHSAPLAKTTFWLLACFGTAGGFHDALPLPRWLSAVSSVSDVLLLSAVAGLAWNLRQTIAGEYRKLVCHPGLRLIGTGVLAWMIAVLLQAVLSRPGVRDLLDFTWVWQARLDLLIFGFCLPVLLGAIWTALPRITGREWPCPVMTNVSTLGLPAGTILLIVGHLLAGLQQGAIINQPGVSFLASMRAVQPYLILANAGMAGITLAVLAFFGNAFLMIWQAGQGCCRKSNLASTEVRP